jgi:hypothetical protein
VKGILFNIEAFHHNGMINASLQEQKEAKDGSSP